MAVYCTAYELMESIGLTLAPVKSLNRSATVKAGTQTGARTAFQSLCRVLWESYSYASSSQLLNVHLTTTW
jgi:hypothetical protein